MQDTTLLQLIQDDIAPAEQLLQLLQAESLALHGRDMQELEDILARKQALVIQLDQRGRKRSELLRSLGLPATRQGLEQLAQQSSVGAELLESGDALTALIGQCQSINEANGHSIQVQQANTAHQIRILSGGDMATLYDSRGSTSRSPKPRPLSQA